MTDISIPPPEPFQDDKFSQADDRRDLTDRQEELNSNNNIVVDSRNDIPQTNVAFDKFARSVFIPDFDMQVNALMHQVSAETLVFQETTVD